ncbi:hypothetical protein [Bacillus swezeyi]|uniref:Uncharacterized protein n=1 Tax=Bacillus swezeyi TaxID=1925020 RepID=A0A5M8RHU0_9BACI|nr:hypothetical protein [Bacillus swezeyi]KAA6446960.1 hypothetical protein DX927_23210 [Bacillus swezeyi]KAA6471528.1 hypothetical protein DX928_23450 [Bacillus swezeyi]
MNNESILKAIEDVRKKIIEDFGELREDLAKVKEEIGQVQLNNDCLINGLSDEIEEFKKT